MSYFNNEYSLYIKLNQVQISLMSLVLRALTKRQTGRRSRNHYTHPDVKILCRDVKN